MGDTLRHAGDRLGVLAGAGFLAAIGILIGLALLIIPGLVLLTWWLVLAPVIMLEGRGVLDCFGRSRRLVSGTGWPVFGVAVLTLLILLAFSLALGIALTPLGDAAARLPAASDRQQPGGPLRGGRVDAHLLPPARDRARAPGESHPPVPA